MTSSATLGAGTNKLRPCKNGEDFVAYGSAYGDLGRQTGTIVLHHKWYGGFALVKFLEGPPGSLFGVAKVVVRPNPGVIAPETA